jgi:hypothetical protein
VAPGRLICASATTGWTDWIHGELWLLPDGIMRLALDLRQTMQHGLERTVPDEPPTRVFDDQEIRSLVGAGRRNLWIAADRIARGSFHQGMMSDRLKLSLKDGGSVKLPWLHVDEADIPLREALVAWGSTSVSAPAATRRLAQLVKSLPGHHAVPLLAPRGISGTPHTVGPFGARRAGRAATFRR